MRRHSWLVLLAIVIVVGLLAGCYLAASLRIAHGFGLPLDDPWIHAVLARNLVEGNGLCYNPGHPVGSTSIIYTLLLAGVYRIAVAPITDAIIFGLLLHIASAWVVYLLVLRLTERRRLAALSAVLFAAIPRLMWGALGGMEVPLYVLLVALGFYLHIRYRWYDGARGYLSTAAFALAALARPECAAFLPVAFLDRMLTSSEFDRDKGGMVAYLARIPLHVALAAAIVAPAIIFNLRSTGYPLPLPFYAKSQLSFSPDMGQSIYDGIAMMPRYAWQVVKACGHDNLAICGAWLVGLVACVGWSKRAEHAGIAILPLGMFLIPMASALTARVDPQLDQLLLQFGRYSAYLVPGMLVIAAVGVVAAEKWLSGLFAKWPMARKGLTRLALAAAVIGLVVSNYTMSLDYAWGVQNVNDMQVKIGKWAAKLPGDTVLATNDAGAIAYFSRLKTIDILGVVNPEVIPFRQKYPPLSLHAICYLKVVKPDYVIIFPNWYRDLAVRTEILDPVDYYSLDHNTICGGDTMVVYKAYW